ncbi:hypothetical protein AVEN_267416-1 [Araneus ventricosus]|uniref:Uncharacterized protein n=1 Tax=Araneus ventricosus TaxID=182803 RepID=A0A4Y2T971_ARAVE|nr:hypothetical protein AVEN_267416-1 [Araneus ventricosus]
MTRDEEFTLKMGRLAMKDFHRKKEQMEAVMPFYTAEKTGKFRRSCDLVKVEVHLSEIEVEEVYLQNGSPIANYRILASPRRIGSPDLTPLAFYLWDRLRSSVYNAPPVDLVNFCRRIQEACLNVTSDELDWVYANIVRRMQLCIDAEGAHFEQIL